MLRNKKKIISCYKNTCKSISVNENLKTILHSNKALTTTPNEKMTSLEWSR